MPFQSLFQGLGRNITESISGGGNSATDSGTGVASAKANVTGSVAAHGSTQQQVLKSKPLADDELRSSSVPKATTIIPSKTSSRRFSNKTTIITIIIYYYYDNVIINLISFILVVNLLFMFLLFLLW